LKAGEKKKVFKEIKEMEGSAHELDNSGGDNSEERDGDVLMEEESPRAKKVAFTRTHKVLAVRNNEALEDFIDLKLVMLKNGLKQRRKNSMHS